VPRLDSVTILIAEDEPLIALDIEGILAAHGATVLGAVSNTEAERHIRHAAPLVAVLDVLLADGESYPLARKLLAAGVKVLFLTGYTLGIPADLQHLPMVEKPFGREELENAVFALLGRG
jgi:DNA-binding response OmpR family regulator